jgi:transposase
MSSQQPNVTVGIDVGDRHSHLCLVDTASGEVLEEGRIPTTPKGFERRFSGCERMRIAIEAGTHSPWVSRLLEGCGHEVLVANARRLRLIYADGRKTDEIDAQKLARLARLDPKLLSPLKHRGEASQAHLALIHSREALVGTRTKLVNHVRATVKSLGHRLPACSAQGFPRKVFEHLPDPLRPALEPVLGTISSLTAQIREYDRKLEAVAEDGIATVWWTVFRYATATTSSVPSSSNLSGLT